MIFLKVSSHLTGTIVASVKENGNEDQQEMLDTLIAGKRLRDISDLPFDLVS